MAKPHVRMCINKDDINQAEDPLSCVLRFLCLQMKGGIAACQADDGSDERHQDLKTCYVKQYN